MNGRFLVFFIPLLTSTDDRSVTMGHVSLRFGVGTSWLVTTRRIFISFDRYFPLFQGATPDSKFGRQTGVIT